MTLPKLNVLDSARQIKELRALLYDAEIVAFDTETTGLTRTHQVIGISVCFEDDNAYYVTLLKWDATAQVLTEEPGVREELVQLLKDLKTKQLVAHNAVFDCSMIEANFNISLIESLHTDTLILSHLLDENRRHGLKELGKEYFGHSVIKEQEEMKTSIVNNGGAITKASYELYKGDWTLIGKYGAQDAMLTYKLFFVLVEELYAQGLEKFFYEDESMPLLKGPTYELNTTGLKMDREALTTLKKTLEAECAEAKSFIHSEIKPYVQDKYPGTTKKNVFNIGSSSQLAWLLFGKLELEFGTLTDGGKEVCQQMGLKLPYTAAAKREFIRSCLRSVGHEYVPATYAVVEEDVVEHKHVLSGYDLDMEPQYETEIVYKKAFVKKAITKAKTIKEPWSYIQVDKKTLTKLAPKHKWIAKLLEYQKNMKMISTYIEGFEERMIYGTVNPGFLQHGTTSGRYASRNPNLQNLPRDDKRIKACVTARPGKVFVGADMSQLEPRIFAFYSGDERLKAAFDGKTDFYSVLGMEVFGKTDCTPQKEGSPDAFGVKYKKLRDITKTIALAQTYGGTAHRLAASTGKSVEETQHDMDRIFAAFPGIKKFMQKCHDEVRTNGQIASHFGRVRRISDAKRISLKAKHDELPYEQRNLLNLSVNHPIQSTGASIVNRAAIRMHLAKNAAGISAKFICQVHDQMVYECDEVDAESTALLLQDSMEHAVELEGIKFEAKPSIGPNLSKV